MSHSDDQLRLSTACRLISTGRYVARQLTTALRQFELNETEFRLLWLLQESAQNQKQTDVDQRILANQLGLSPAQVSTTVEKLRQQGTVEPITDSKDRRRQLWKLTSKGYLRFETISKAIGLLSRDWTFSEPSSLHVLPPPEDAA